MKPFTILDHRPDIALALIVLSVTGVLGGSSTSRRYPRNRRRPSGSRP